MTIDRDRYKAQFELLLETNEALRNQLELANAIMNIPGQEPANAPAPLQ